jgi:hypothetical protein
MNVLVKTSLNVDNVDSEQIIMAGVLSEAETAYHLRPTGFIPDFLGVRVSHFFCFELCFCALLVFLLCFVCPMLPVSFHCPFLIAPFFSIVYLTLQLGIVALTDVSGVRHYHVNDWWISLTQINA